MKHISALPRICGQVNWFKQQMMEYDWQLKQFTTTMVS